jgi:ABC-type nitrate/sulfonate/bicarbonate transport system substrate-binding protein
MSRFTRPQSLALAAVLFITCGVAAARAQNAQRVSLRLDWVTSGYHAPYFVGIKNGYYKDAGLDVSIAIPDSAIGSLQMIGTKKSSATNDSRIRVVVGPA